jgi:fibronectin-binding autotransporter adhesin
MKASPQAALIIAAKAPRRRRWAGTALCALLLALGAIGARAGIYTQTVDQSTAGSTAHWNLSIWSNDGGVTTATPSAANTYVIPSGVTMQARTPVIVGASTSTNLWFWGAWVTNLNSSTPGIRFLHGNVAVNANLVLNGGNITTAGQSGATWGGLAGNLIVGSGGAFQCFGSTARYDYWLMPNLVLRGSGTLTVNMAAANALSGVISACDASGYTGAWTVSKGRLEIQSGTTNAIGSGKITLTSAPTAANPSWLLFNSTNTLVMSNAVVGAGFVVKQNTGSVTLLSTNGFTSGLTNLGGLLVLTRAGIQTNTTISASGVLRITTNTALPAASVLTIDSSGASTGRLELSNSLTLSLTNALAVSQRNNSSAAIQNLSGASVLSNSIAIQTGASGSFVGLQVDAGSLELKGGVSCAASGASVLGLQGSGTGLISGPISDGVSAAVTVRKTGSGTWTLNNANTYSGPTYVSNGVFRLGAAGSVSNTAAIQLEAGTTFDATAASGITLGAQTLRGQGALLGNVATSPGTVVEVGFAGQYGRLNLSNNLTLGGGTISFDIGPATNDILNVTGSLTLNASTTNLINMPDGPVPAGTYRLINYSGTLHGSGSFVVAARVRQTLAVDTSTPGQVNLIVTGTGFASLLWSGDGVNNVWDVVTTPNWNAHTEMFYFGDNVTFDDTGSATPAVNVSVPVLAGSVTVSNSAQAYTFSDASITGIGNLTKRGGNLLTLVNNGNTFDAVDLQEGTLAIGDGTSTNGSLVAGLITNNGALLINLLYSADATVVGGPVLNGSISGAGSVEVAGGGDALTLGGANSYAGPTTIDPNCAIYLQHNSALGSPAAGTTVQNGGRLGFTAPPGNWTVAEPLILNGNGFAAAGAPGALWMDTDNNVATLTGPVTLASPTQIRLTALNTLTFSNAVTAADQPLQCTVDAASGVVNFKNTVSLGSGAAFTKDGAGTVVLSGSSNLWASTAVNAGSLRIVTTNPPQIGDVVVNSGSLKIGSATDSVSGSLPPGLINLVAAGASLTINTSNRLTLANPVIGAGQISLFTNDVLTITATNTFTGPVYLGSATMSSGVLDLQNSSGLGDGSAAKTVSLVRSELQLHGNLDLPALIRFDISGNAALANPGNGLRPIHSISDTNIIQGNIRVSTEFFSGTSGGEIACDNGELTINGGVSPVTYATALNLYLSGTNGSGIINGVVSGSGTYPLSVVKLGEGTWTLNNYETYTGTTYVTNGTLRLGASGALPSTAAIHLEAGGTFDVTAAATPFTLGAQTLRGKGAVLGDVTTSAGSLLEAGFAGQYGELNLSNNLTLGGSDTLSLEVGPSGNDTLNVSGLLTLNGSTTIGVSLPEGTVSNGTYRLINYSGTLQGAGSFVLVPPGIRQSFALDTTTPGQVNLVITGSSTPTNLVWAGTAGNIWDIRSTPNWNAGAEMFYNRDQVTFDDTGVAGQVNVAVPVQPGTVTVDNTANAYTLGGSAITSPGLLAKRGANLLVLANNGNSFSAIDIAGGTLSLGDGNNSNGSLGSGPITNNGALVANLFYSYDASVRGGPTLDNPISGSGSLEVMGGGNTVTLMGPNTYDGTTTIDANCAIYVQHNSALGTATGGTTVQAGGQLGFTAPAGNWTLAEPLTLNGNGFEAVGIPGALWLNTANNAATLTGPVTLGSATRIQTADASALTFANTVAGANQALWCTVSNAAGVVNFKNTLSLGSGGFTKDGPGQVVLGGPTNLCASTVVSNGSLRITATNPPQIGDVTVYSTGTGALYIGNSTDNLGGALPSGIINLVPSGANMTINTSNLLSLTNRVIGAGTVTLLTNNALTITASNSFTGTLTIGSGSLSAGSVDLRNSYGLGNSAKTVTIGRSELQLRGDVDIPAAITFSIVGDAGQANPGNGLMPIRNVSGTNAIEGTVNVVAGTGTGEVGCDRGQLSLNGTVQNGTTTVRTLYLGGTNGIGIINGAVGNGTGAGGANALTVIKRGAGTWILNGAVTNTGNLTLQDGTLKLGAATASLASTNIQLVNSPVFDVSALSAGLTVSNYATLKGNGTILGKILAAGTVSPAAASGTGIGALSVSGTLTNLSTGTNVMEINRAANPNADLITAGTVALGGTLKVTNLGAALQDGDTFKLFDASLSGTFAATNLPALASTNLYWDASLLNSQGILRVLSKVPTSPSIQTSVLSGTNLVLTVPSQTGFTYVLEATPTLVPPGWAGVQTNAGGGLLTFTIPIDSAEPKRFFRVRVQ